MIIDITKIQIEINVRLTMALGLMVEINLFR
jgi:hypothetical protein